MKLKLLRLIDFGPFQDATFTPGAPVVLIYGPNAQGKSSLPDSIEWLLTNRTRGVSERGDGARELIRQGAQEAAVEAEWETAMGGTVTMRRKVGPKGIGTIGLPDTDRLLKTAASVFCHAEGMVNEDPDRQRAALMAAVEPRIPVAQLAEAVPLDEVPKALGVPWPAPDGATVGRSEVEALFQWAYAERTAVNRQLKAPIPPAPDWGPKGKPDLAKLEEQLGAVKAQERAETKRLAEERGRKRALNDRLRKVMGQQKVLEDKARLLRFRTAAQYQQAIAEQEAALEAHRTAVRDWQEATGALDAEIGRRQPILDQLERSYKGVQALGEACVIHESIRCPLTTEDRRDVLLRMARKIEELEGEIGRLQVQRPPAPASGDALEQALENLREEAKRFHDHETELGAGGGEIKDLLEQGAKVSEALPGEMLPAPDPPDLVALRQRVERGDRIMAQARQMAQAEATRTTAIADQDRWRRQSERLETAVKALGPKGLLDQALSRSLEQVLARTNEYLAPWGWQVTFTLEPFRLLVDGRAVVRRSASERWRIGAALAMACAVACGWRTVFLDGADALLPEHRALLVRMIEAARTAGLLVIVTAAAATPPAGPAPPGVQRWWLAEGKLDVLRPVAA